jgi:hypothetical protein
MEIKVKDKQMVEKFMQHYLDGVIKGELPHPKCVICKEADGELLGIYSKENEAVTTIYSLCFDCWTTHSGPGAEDLLRKTGKLDDVIIKKINAAVEQVVKTNSPDEIFRVVPNEWVN